MLILTRVHILTLNRLVLTYAALIEVISAANPKEYMISLYRARFLGHRIETYAA